MRKIAEVAVDVLAKLEEGGIPIIEVTLASPNVISVIIGKEISAATIILWPEGTEDLTRHGSSGYYRDMVVVIWGVPRG